MSETMTFEEDLAQDVLEIITVFSARLYGSRSHKNKALVKELREVLKDTASHIAERSQTQSKHNIN